MIAPKDLFDLNGLSHASLFQGLDKVWDALDRIKEYTEQSIEKNGRMPGLFCQGEVMLSRTVVIHNDRVHDSDFELLGGDPTKGQMKVRLGGEIVTTATVVYAGAVFMDNNIYLAPGCKIEPGALIKGPSYIGEGTEVRQGAYLRGGCLIGNNCVVGHTTEIKNSVMLDGAKAGHFAYLGDSILGRDVNLGAGTKLANLKIVETPYKIKVGDETYVIKRRKFGAILGDRVETGCNTVTNPGTIMGKRSMVAPCSSVPGNYHKPRTIIR